MSLLNWLNNLKSGVSRKEKNVKLLKIAEELVERLEREIDNLADKALHTPGEYIINRDNSRSTIKTSLYYRIEAEKLFPELLDELFSRYPGVVSGNEKRTIKKLVASKTRELHKNEVELGLCSVDVLDVPDKTRRRVKRVLDSKLQGRVDLGAFYEACTMIGLKYVSVKISLETLERLKDELLGKTLIIFHEHAIRFRGFDAEGNVRGVSGNDSGAIRRILVSPSGITEEERVILFLQKEIDDRYLGIKVLSEEELKNINIGPAPDHARVLYLKGRELYDNLHRYEEAMAAFDKVIELAPDHSGAWDYKVRYFENLKRYEEALKAIDKLIEVDSLYREANRNRRRVILGHLQGDKETLGAFR